MAKKATAKKKDSNLPAVSKGEGTLIPADSFKILSDPTAIEVIKNNLQGESISEFDLQRIKVPGGGAVSWEVEDITGEIDSVKEIRGILIYVGIRRGYWEDPNPSGSPPDCSSMDGHHGMGSPGGSCMACPLNQFGTSLKPDGSQGKGKRCRETRCVLVLREDDLLPMAIFTPPSSLKGFKQYLMKLRHKLFQVVTVMSLEKDKNTDGIAYSKIKFSFGGHLSDDVAGKLEGYGALLKEAMNSFEMDSRDFGVEPPEGDDGNTVEGSVSGSDNPDNYSTD